MSDESIAKLLDRVNALLWTLDTFKAPAIDDEQRRQGYAQAITELQVLPELATRIARLTTSIELRAARLSFHTWFTAAAAAVDVPPPPEPQPRPDHATT